MAQKPEYIFCAQTGIVQWFWKNQTAHTVFAPQKTMTKIAHVIFHRLIGKGWSDLQDDLALSHQDYQRSRPVFITMSI